MRLIIIDELDGKTIGGHFGRLKTLALVRATFYWLRMERDVTRFVKCCSVCLMAMTRSQTVGLYTLLPVLNAPWENVSLNFIVGLLRTQKSKDLIMVVVD